MAGSVNDIANHKAGFNAWWEAGMQQADACGRVEKLIMEPPSAEARKEVAGEL